MKYSSLLARYPIISDQISRPALAVVLNELEQVLNRNIPGPVAEFGCYVGTTSLFIRRLLDMTQQSDTRLFYAYDSFDGLPNKTSYDLSDAGTEFKEGKLRTGKKQIVQNFLRANLRPPVIHKAWFKDLLPENLPSELSFAFLDGDFYESIMSSLQAAWPRLNPGGTITIDDYQREALPGVTKAVHDFFGPSPSAIHLRFERNIAIIKKS